MCDTMGSDPRTTTHEEAPVTAYPAWTPASRPGIVPLHPLSFGTILGRSFVALRQNPRVLLGFALGVQTIAFVVVLLVVGGIAWASFSRLDTLREGTDEFNAVLSGSVALTAVAGFVLGLAAGVLSLVVQAVVVVEVTHAVVAEKLSLGALWKQVKPAMWRLIGYTALLIGVIVVATLVVGVGVVLLATLSPPAAIGLTVLLVLLLIPVVWWLTIKLLLVPAVIVIEGAGVGAAIARAWTLIRGRFWVALGVILLISVTFSAVGQVVGLPFSFLSSGLTVIISPTGEPSVGAIIGMVVTLLVTYGVLLLIQAMAVVVQSTATTLVYVDCRMRREGLDLDLLAYVERRDAGAADLPDPYTSNIGRVIAPRHPGVAGGFATAPGTFPGTYAPAGYAPVGPPTASTPTVPPPAGYSAPSAAAPAPQTPSAPAAPRTPHGWTAPGAPADGTDRESPWA